MISLSAKQTPADEAGTGSEAEPLSKPGRTMFEAIRLVFSSRLLASGAAALSTFIVARLLQPEAFAHFMFLFLLMNLFENLVGPPLDASLVRFMSRSLSSADGREESFFRFVTRTKLAIALVMITLSVVLAPVIHRHFIKGDAAEQVPYGAVVMACAGGAAIMLWRVAQSHFQAHEHFRVYSRVEILNSFLRLIFVLALFAAGVRSIVVLLAAYVLAPTLVGAFTWGTLPRESLTLRRPDEPLFREFFQYAQWMILASVFATLGARVDAFLLPAFNVDEAERGTYFAALVLVNMGNLVVITLFHVMLPRASRLRKSQERKRFLAKSFWPCLAASVCGAVILPFSEIFAVLVYGEAYRATGTIFAILTIGVLVSFLAVPAGVTVMSAGRSGILAAIEGAKFFSIAFGGAMVLAWAPINGTVAMAWTIALTKMAAVVVTFVVALWVVNSTAAEGEQDLLVE